MAKIPDIIAAEWSEWDLSETGCAGDNVRTRG
jgi:hypothetical protein